MDERPVIRCLVAKPLATGFLVIRYELAALDEAAELQGLGFQVLVDPADEAALVRWEAIQRSQRGGLRTTW